MTASTYINGLTKLGLSSAAAALSATIIKQEMLPVQLQWLGVAGTIVAACMIPITFAEQSLFSRKRLRLACEVFLLLLLGTIIWLRSSFLVTVGYAGRSDNFLIGTTLSDTGRQSLGKCAVSDDTALLKCTGPDLIPQLYRKFGVIKYLYIADYLLLLAVFVALVSTLDVTTHAPRDNTSRPPPTH